jgi:hypothetical protein
MIFVRKTCGDAELLILVSAVEEAGGKILSFCQALDGHWQVFARVPNSSYDQIDRNFQQVMRALEKEGAFVETLSKKRRLRKKK